MKNSIEGLFDLRSLGVSIFCDSEENVKSVIDFKNGSSEIFFPLSFDNNSSTIRRNTTYWHESRHFHDHLLCPYLNYLYRMRLIGVLHASQFVDEWRKQCDLNALPIPLTKWIRKSKEGKEQYLASKQRSIKLNAPAFDVFDSGDYSKLIELVQNGIIKDKISGLVAYASAHYDEYHCLHKKIHDQYNREFSIHALMEASALIVQTFAIQLLYGHDCYRQRYDELMKWLFGEKEHTRFNGYNSVLSILNGYLGKELGYQFSDFLAYSAYVIQWCCWGNILEGGNNANPLFRLNKFENQRLADSVSLDGLKNDPIAVFDYWDRSIGCSKMNLQDCIEWQESIFAHLIYSFNDIGNKDMSEFCQRLSAASMIMLNNYFEQPSKYISPSLYLSHMNDYVNIPVRFVKSHNTELIWEVDHIDNPIESQCSTLDTNLCVLKNMHDQCSCYFDISDALFGDGLISNPGFIIQKVLKGTKTFMIW